MAGRIVLGGVIGGVVLFLWGAVAHMLLGLGNVGMQQIPNEDAVLTAMRENMPEPGLYFFPWIDETRTGSAEQRKEIQQQWEAKYRTGPSGLLVYRPRADQSMSPGQLMTQLAIDIASAVLAAYLLAQAIGQLGHPAARVVFVSLLGLLGGLMTDLPYWNWYGFPTDYTLASIAERVIGFFLAGLVLVPTVRRPAPAIPLPGGDAA